MIENARRQAILVLLVALAAMFSTFQEPILGPDLKGGTMLIYEVPIDEARARGDIGPEESIETIMDDAVKITRDRIDPHGVREVSVTKRGNTGILIELPAMPGAELDDVERAIENIGRLEMRVLATADYPLPDGLNFELAEEMRLLADWLGPEGSPNRAMLVDDPTQISAYNVPSGTGFAISEYLRWYPRLIKADARVSEQWDYSFAKDTPADWAVQAFNEAEWNNRVRGDNAPETLLEFLPINMHEVSFSGDNLDASGIQSTLDRNGQPAVGYRIKAANQDDYANWTEKYLGKKSAIILNDLVHSAPVFEGRIRSDGQISGRFTETEVQDLVRVLKTGSLKVKPVLQQRQTIGATLGAQSVRLGFISIVAGGALVLLFILMYYRLAGIVAFIGIALNVLLIWGALQFLRATLTLPGIAGMVLTMGMAVDANILIYERIREELRRGKALLQAIRTGFERAMVTILDANITTFIAGVVLYNIGVGPIRGFAVTLMVGIITTLFTAFVVSRLVFHYLLKFKILREFKVLDLFKSFSFDFLKFRVLAFATSTVLIVTGLIHAFGFVPRETLLGLDFTGGASLQVVLKEPVAVADMRQRLANDDAFSGDFENPLVNTVGDLQADGLSQRFNLKLKLTDQQREDINDERTQAALEDRQYTPPYITHLKRILEDDLVDPAFSAPRVDRLEFTAIGSLNLHFATPVTQTSITDALTAQRLPEITVKPGAETGATVGRNWLVEWDVALDTEEIELFAMVREGLRDLTDTEGNPVLLSNPFPEAEEIGGRMVGELRNAAIGAMVMALFLIVMYIRIRFHEYKYGLAAVAALIHDVLIAFGILAFVNNMGLVSAELNLAMIAAFLTIIGYSINDTIVIFDRIRENLSDQARLGDTKESFRQLINRSINQTLSRTILTSSTTLFVVLAQFVVNYGSGSALEGFSFALMIGILTGTYSTMFIASPIVLWLREREKPGSKPETVSQPKKPVPVGTGT